MIVDVQSILKLNDIGICLLRSLWLSVDCFHFEWKKNDLFQFLVVNCKLILLLGFFFSIPPDDRKLAKSDWKSLASAGSTILCSKNSCSILFWNVMQMKIVALKWLKWWCKFWIHFIPHRRRLTWWLVNCCEKIFRCCPTIASNNKVDEEI